VPKFRRSSSPRVRWTPVQAGAVLAEQQASGLSLLAVSDLQNPRRIGEDRADVLGAVHRSPVKIWAWGATPG
jgi:hypothetical protein